jgi:urea transport system substrate-binding protein
MLKGCKVVGEEYFPLGNTQFNSVINKIKLTKPDVIYAIIVGGSNVAFYKQLKAAGIDLSKADSADHLGDRRRNRRHRRREHRGAYACMKYFQSLDNPNNKLSCPRSRRCGARRP